LLAGLKSSFGMLSAHHSHEDLLVAQVASFTESAMLSSLVNGILAHRQSQPEASIVPNLIHMVLTAGDLEPSSNSCPDCALAMLALQNVLRDRATLGLGCQDAVTVLKCLSDSATRILFTAKNITESRNIVDEPMYGIMGQVQTKTVDEAVKIITKLSATKFMKARQMVVTSAESFSGIVWKQIRRSSTTVYEFLADSLAQAMGIRPDDILISVNGHAVYPSDLLVPRCGELDYERQSRLIPDERPLVLKFFREDTQSFQSLSQQVLSIALQMVSSGEQPLESIIEACLDSLWMIASSPKCSLGWTKHLPRVLHVSFKHGSMWGH